jgi:hypothetical protein
MTVGVFVCYLNTEHTKSNCGLTNTPLPKQPHFPHFCISDQFLSWERISYCLHLLDVPFFAPLLFLRRDQIKVSRQNKQELFSAMCMWSQQQQRMLKVDQSNRYWATWPAKVFRRKLLACCHNWPWDTAWMTGDSARENKSLVTYGECDRPFTL